MLQLTGTRVAEYFRFGCERQLRFELTPAAARGGEVPARNLDPARGPLVGRRPGSEFLVRVGRAWERRKLRQLVERYGERVRLAGWTERGGVQRLPYDEVVALLRAPGDTLLLAQPELRLPDPAAFARRYGLDPERVAVAPATPDLIRLRRSRAGELRLQLMEIKASPAPSVAHLAQLAYYSLVLEEICRAEGIAARVDVRRAWVWLRRGGGARRGPERVPLGAYRHHVERFLATELPRLTAQPPAAAAWQVAPRCAGCVYLEYCRAEAERGDDVGRVAGLSPRAKQVLQTKGVRTVRQLADSLRRDTYSGCHSLEADAARLKQRAQALRYGKVFDVDATTQLMPPREDVRLIVTAEGDPVSRRCFALGLQVVAERGRGARHESALFVAEAGPRDESRMLGAFLAHLQRALAQAAAGGGPTVHLYTWDRAELELLRGALLRHVHTPELRQAVLRVLALLGGGPGGNGRAPRAALPGTVVQDVVAALFALPLPYAYDLAGVSAVLQPREQPCAYRPAEGFGEPFSSQVGFERIHEVWRRHGFVAGERRLAPEEVLAEIRRTVAMKLAAVDAVVRAIRERSARKPRLHLRQAPLPSAAPDAPLADPLLERLRVFARLEAAAEALAVQALHALPAAERARKGECIRGLQCVSTRGELPLVFEFDPACRDAKFRAGDFNLLLTNDDERSLAELGRQPWQRRRLQVELLGYELDADAARPRLRLSPSGDLAAAERDGLLDLERHCVLDRAPADFSTPRLLAMLAALDGEGAQAAALRARLRGEPPAAWAPPFAAGEPAAEELLTAAGRRLGREVLNRDQRSAWSAAFREPLSLVWGPPGTGKTYLLAWMLLGLAAAAERAGRPCRVLVSAATHRAIVNVLARLARELEAAGISVPLQIVKLRGSGNDADAELDGGVARVLDDARLPGLLAGAEAGGALVVGATVWSLWKQLRAARGPEAPGEVAPQPWFDVVVIDEASQMKVAEALIAFAALRPGGSVILCGDDQQLAPIVRGRYDDAADDPLMGSVFGYFAQYAPRRILRESRRMNAALVSYPRELFYPRLVSMCPAQRVALDGAAPDDPLDARLREAFLAPDDAAVLFTYGAGQSLGMQRNAFEAALAARLARLARAALLDPDTGQAFDAEGFVARGLTILSPHRAQNSAILAELQALGFAAGELPVVDTVERLQGNEREVVIVSYAVADREFAEAEAEFLLNPNRFNVAITRARSKLIVLLSDEVLRAVPQDPRVLGASLPLQGYPAHCADAVRELELPAPGGGVVRGVCRYRRAARAHTSLAPGAGGA